MSHHVLAIGVPALDAWVRARTAHYDASFLSADPNFSHAHITLLSPWVAHPTRVDLDRVGRIAAEHPAFEFSLSRLGVFPNGVVHLVPDPSAPFTALTERLCAAFPQCDPYDGQFPELVPHLTLDQRSAEVTVAAVRSSLGDLIPARARAEQIQLQHWGNHECRVVHTWSLR